MHTEITLFALGYGSCSTSNFTCSIYPLLPSLTGTIVLVPTTLIFHMTGRSKSVLVSYVDGTGDDPRGEFSVVGKEYGRRLRRDIRYGPSVQQYYVTIIILLL